MVSVNVTALEQCVDGLHSLRRLLDRQLLTAQQLRQQMAGQACLEEEAGAVGRILEAAQQESCRMQLLERGLERISREYGLCADRTETICEDAVIHYPQPAAEFSDLGPVMQALDGLI